MKNLIMRGLLLSALFTFFSVSGWAKLSDHAYYSPHLAQLQKEQNENLKALLFDAINNQRVFSYKEARRLLFGDIYLEKKDGRYVVTDTYCEEDFNSSVGVGPGRIPNHNVINCEHTWPQSRFNGRQSRSAQKSDLHHLFPTKSVANSTRGNILFGEVNGESVSNCAASLRGNDIYENHDAFEPPKSHKGNVARALFYFAVRYKINIPDDEEVHLRRWHRLDPVDSDEIARHERIYELQGNRNPFIDDVDLIDSITNI
jgi:hypothetical protein